MIGFVLGATGPSRDLIVRNATPRGAAGRVYGFVYSGLDVGSTIAPDLVRRDARPRHGPRHVSRDRATLLIAIGTVVQIRTARRRCGDRRRSDCEMDLGIAGRRALVCAASKGLGRGCAEALARAGCEVTIVARTEDVLRATATEIGARAGDATSDGSRADITTPEGRAKALAACPQPDILVNNAGGPPPGDFRDWDRAAWIRALDANMLTPIELIKATSTA